MKILQLGDWGESIVILEKIDKRPQPINLVNDTNVYSSFRLNSRDIVDKASFVCYVEDGFIKKVLKDRFDDGRYELIISSFLKNDMRYKKLKYILT